MTGARYCLLLLPAVAPAPPTALLSCRAAHDFLCAGRTRENRGTVCFDVAASAGGTPAVSRFQANSPKGAKLCGFHGVASVNAGRAQRMALFLADGRWPATPGGAVVVETEDMPWAATLPRADAAALAARGVPVLVYSAATSYSTWPAEFGSGGNDTRPYVLAPDHDYVASRGYADAFWRRAPPKYAWAAKAPHAVWRGSSTGPVVGDPAKLDQNARLALCRRAQNLTVLDARISNVVQLRGAVAELVKKNYKGAPILPETWLAAKAVVDVDGNSNSWAGCFWKLGSNSVVLKVVTELRQWYYPLLAANTHFVPVASDLSDLDTRLRAALDPANDAAMRKIADAATALMNSTRMRYGPTADAFARYLAGRFSRRDGGGAPGPAASAAPEPPPGPLGLADRLEKLAALHERGVLTDAEFAKAKALQLGL